MAFHQLRSQNLPGPILAPQICIPEFSDEAYITAIVNDYLDRLPLEELCGKDGVFPEKIIVDHYGKAKRIENSHSKMPPKDFYKYVIGHFDISILNPDQKQWFDKAVKDKLKGISKKVKKANAPKKQPVKKEKPVLTDRERQQKRFERILKIVEKANAEKNNPTM